MLSLRRRLVLIHVLASVVTVGAAAFAGWYELSRSVRGQLDAALLALAETEAGMLADAKGIAVHVHEAPVGTAPPSLNRLDRLVQIIDAQGRVLARSSNLGASKLPASPSLLQQLAAGETVFDTLPDTSEEPLRMVSVPLLVGSQRFAVQVAGSLDDVNHVVESASVLFAGMATLLLVALGLVGTSLTRRVFVAIENVVNQARSIGDSNLDRRLPHPGVNDEIGGLVDTLNAMLARLERAFDAQRRFTADASHELRSPLSRLRTEIEVTLRRPRESDDYIATLRSCLDEVERLTMLVEELLMLARFDAGEERAPVEPVSLASLAQETIRRLERHARERQVQIALESGPAVMANAAYAPVSLVLSNLLDNALKFTPSGSSVVVRIAAGPQGATLSVEDQGTGISRNDLPFLFDRFYRGAGARAGEVDGVGLGLALSQSIMRAYGGQLEASNSPSGGALFTMLLPLAN